MSHPSTSPNPARRQCQRIKQIHKQLDELRTAVTWYAESAGKGEAFRLHRAIGLAVAAEDLAESLAAALRPVGQKEW
jgi:hypothetical protein